MKRCLLCKAEFDGHKNVCEKCFVEKVLPLKKTTPKQKVYVEPKDWWNGKTFLPDTYRFIYGNK